MIRFGYHFLPVALVICKYDSMVCIQKDLAKKITHSYPDSFLFQQTSLTIDEEVEQERRESAVLRTKSE